MNKLQPKEYPTREDNILEVHEPSFVIPEGYMTGDEFERRVKERVTQFYKEHGLI